MAVMFPKNNKLRELKLMISVKIVMIIGDETYSCKNDEYVSFHALKGGCKMNVYPTLSTL